MSLRVILLWCKQNLQKNWNKHKLKTDRLKTRILLFVSGTFPMLILMLTKGSFFVYWIGSILVYMAFLLTFFKLEFDGEVVKEMRT